MIIDEMLERHRELVEVGQEHNDAYDSFVDDDTNWIIDEDGSPLPKTGSIAEKWNALELLCSQQDEAIAKSHEQISQVASTWEDTGGRNAAVDHKFSAFFTEFGI